LSFRPDTIVAATTQLQDITPDKQTYPPQYEPSFQELKHTQYIEEKANEVYLVLKMNANVLSELKGHYHTIIESEDCPDKLKRDCKGNVSSFERRVSSVINDMQIQQSTLQTLLRLLSDRKTLVSCHIWEVVYTEADPR
jgi:hypothetical protein